MWQAKQMDCEDGDDEVPIVIIVDAEVVAGIDYDNDLDEDPEDECDNEDRDQSDFAGDEIEAYRMIDEDDSPYDY